MMNWSISVVEPFYVFIYLSNITNHSNNDKSLTLKDLIKLYISHELKRIYNCQVIVVSNNGAIGFCDQLFYEHMLEDVNYVYLCDVMRKVQMKEVEPLNITSVYELSSLFAIACLSIPGYYKLTINRHCLVFTDDYKIDFAIDLLNKNVMRYDILTTLPKWVLDIEINNNNSLSRNQLRKLFNKNAFSGGRDTKEEQIKYGANLDVDESFKVLKLFGNKSDIERVKHLYGTDELNEELNEKRMLSGEVKTLAADSLYDFIQTNKHHLIP